MDEVEFERIASAISDSTKQIVKDIVDDVGPLYINWVASELRIYARDRVRQHGPLDAEATGILNLFDRAMAEGNAPLSEAIGVSVVEGSNWTVPELHALFGPNLKREWLRQQDWNSGRDQERRPMPDRVSRWWFRLWERLKW